MRRSEYNIAKSPEFFRGFFYEIVTLCIANKEKIIYNKGSENEITTF